MRLPCEIVQDLLPLYEDNLCSPASEAAVEEHLRECPNCRTQAESVRHFIRPEPPEQMRGEDQAVARTFRKVRRRWAVSLIAMLMVVPVLLLTVNQIRGQGLCFTNVGQVLAAGRYVRALEAGDTERAAACMDYAGMYEELLALLDMAPEEWGMDCTAFTIEDEVWLAKGDFYQQYLQNETDALNLWAGLLHNRFGGIMIPETVWQEITSWEPGSVTATEDGQLLLNEVAYVRLETPWGIYITESGNDVTDCQTAKDFCDALVVIPEAIYDAAKTELTRQAADQYAYIQETYGAVRQMDLEEFTDHVAGAYADDLTQCLRWGYRFESTGYEESYLADGQWHIGYGVEISRGGESCKLVLEFHVEKGKLHLTSMHHRESITGLDDVCEMLFLTYPADDTLTPATTDEG